jgi:predicted acyltransferase
MTAPATAPRERLLSLDIFRGMTVAGMLLVNNPGTWSAIYPPLGHAAWHGWTPTDLIFPFFLFIVGITTHLSLTSRRAAGADEGMLQRQVLRRGALIFLVGLLLSGFPFFTWGTVPGNPDPGFLDRVAHRLEVWRIMGVLQRIGLAYMFSALLTLRLSLRGQVMAVVVLLFGYWALMTLVPVPGHDGAIGALLLDKPSTTLAAYVDRMLLDWTRFGLGNHIWSGGKTWDPEGILSTIPAVGTAMLGTITARWISRPMPLTEKLSGLFAAGALGIVAGQMWHWSFPINKGIWTSSYVIFTAGVACVTLATIMWAVDHLGIRRGTKFFVVYGSNALVAFVGSGLMARMIYSILKADVGGKEVSLQNAIYQVAYASWLSPRNASLLFAVSFVMVWYAILWLLWKRRIFVKL